MTCLADLSLRRLWSSYSITMREPVTWRRRMVKWSTWNILWIYQAPLQKGIHPLCCWLLPLIKWSKNHSHTGKKRVMRGNFTDTCTCVKGTSGAIKLCRSHSLSQVVKYMYFAQFFAQCNSRYEYNQFMLYRLTSWYIANSNGWLLKFIDHHWHW